MTLLSLLLALALDRMMVLPANLQLNALLLSYRRLFAGDGNQASLLSTLLIAVLPALAGFLLLYSVVDAWFGLLSILILTLLILICISNLHYRKLYKHYVKAACRGDEQACYHVAEQLGARLNDNDATLSVHRRLENGVGQQLSWVSYQYYIGVMLWLILFGPLGMLLYAVIRELAEGEHRFAPAARQLNRLMDWLPVRVASFGLAMVGNFSRAIPVWLEQQLRLDISPRQHLISVAMKAEQIENPGNPTCIDSTCKFVEIGKRNVMLTITLISIMTIYGSLI